MQPTRIGNFEVARVADYEGPFFAPGDFFPDFDPAVVEEHATEVGFEVSRVQSLRLHYAKTLDIWATALEARKDEAIAIQSEEVYERYMRYLNGCADLFSKGNTDVCQFTLVKPHA